MKKKNRIFDKKRMISIFLAIMVAAMFIAASSVTSISINNKEPSLEQPPATGYGTGFMAPEVDLSHLTGQEMPERFIGITPPSSFDWRTSGKVTSVKDQGGCDACYAFASIGCFESKIMLHGGGTYDLSEDNVKECEWYHSCCNPSNFYKVASFLSQSGNVLESCDPYQPFHNNNPPCGSCPFQQTLLDWRVISGGNSVPSTNVLKNYIYNEGPIYVSLWIGNSPSDATWKNEFSNYDGSYTLYKPWTGGTDHAVLIIGWDDSLTHAGGTGGWICKNSWGTDWGGTCGYGTEKGYFTIAYNSAAVGKYSSFVDQWGNYDTNGGITYHDEGGWSYSWGYSSNTAWGLCEHGFWVDTTISRVEFWTTDKTTDVDVYIYDNFDGTTLSNLLWSSLNHAFDEAGYHGVALVPPMTVMGMNAIYVVIKFTNSNYKYPVAADHRGPTLTGKTFSSPDGSSGSWFDRGIGSPKSDVAIRLRGSGDTPPGNPSINGPNSGSPGTAYTYDFVSIDLEGDEVSFYIKWGDGTETDWTPFQSSGSKYFESHTWGSEGTYTVEAKARDIYGVESDWTTLQIMIKKGRSTDIQLLRLVEIHPRLLPLLQYLLQLFKI